MLPCKSSQAANAAGRGAAGLRLCCPSPVSRICTHKQQPNLPTTPPPGTPQAEEPHPSQHKHTPLPQEAQNAPLWSLLIVNYRDGPDLTIISLPLYAHHSYLLSQHLSSSSKHVMNNNLLAANPGALFLTPKSSVLQANTSFILTQEKQGGFHTLSVLLPKWKPLCPHTELY